MRTPLKSIAMAAIRQLPILLILLIGAIGVQTFTSCGKGGDEVKLLESITDDKGNLERKFEYDKQNRLVKIYSGKDSTIITYNSDDLVTVKTSDGDKKYVRKGNTVTLDKETFIINEEEYLVKRESNGHQYQYQNGNLIQEGSEDPASDYLNTDYSYDDKKSPFSNCASPKWLLQSVLSYSAASKNNVTGISYEGGSSGYEYEYDSDGFPTKETNTVYDAYEGGNESTTITRFTYRGKGGNAPAKAENSLEQTNKAEAQAAAKPDTLYITETCFVESVYEQDSEDFAIAMKQANEELKGIDIERVYADSEKRYFSFALDNGKQYVIEREDLLLYKKGHQPIIIPLDRDVPPNMPEIYKYLGINPLENASASQPEDDPGRYVPVGLWGWSKNGKAAISQGDNQCTEDGGGVNSFYIVDLATNKILFDTSINTCGLYPEEDADPKEKAEKIKKREKLEKDHNAKIEAAVKEHGIISHDSKLRSFPLVVGNFKYTAEMREKSKKVVISRNGSEKTIETFQEGEYVNHIDMEVNIRDVVGYYKSPYENKILVVVRTVLGPFELRGYDYIGCDLEEGFK